MALRETNSRRARAYERRCAAGTSVSVSCVCLLLREEEEREMTLGRAPGETRTREKRETGGNLWERKRTGSRRKMEVAQ